MPLVDCKKKSKIYDWLIIAMISSVIISGPFWGAFTPIRILGILTLSIVVLNKKSIYKIKRISYFFSLFIIYAIISFVWAFDKGNAIIDLFQLICYVGVFCGIYYSSIRAQKPINSIFNGWLIFTLLNLAVSYWEIFTGNHLENGMYQSDHMAVGMDGIKTYLVYSAVTYGNYNSLSIVMVLCYYMTILYISYTESKQLKVFLIFIIFLIFGVEIINNSRGCMLACILGIFPMFKAIKNNRVAKYLLYFIFIGTAIFAIFQFGEVIYFLIERKITARTGGFWGDDRWKLWASSIDVASNYFFLGSGPGSQIYELKSVNALNHYAHNMWLQTLIEYGVGITMILAYCIFGLMKKTIKSKDKLVHTIGVILLYSWPILTIVDEGYMKPIHWIFFASLLSLFHRSLENSLK